MANSSLHNAKKVKNDEFFTRYKDISAEMGHYREHFKEKTIYCNCDDPIQSNFWRYFHNNFASLKLKRLIATHYRQDSEPSYALIYDGNDDFNMEAGKIVTIYGDEKYTAGDFRSNECINFLKEADIVITNPPFSLFKEYVAQLIEYNKKFIIIGNKNAVGYKEIFPFIKNNKVWIGNRNMNSDFWLYVPEGAKYEKLDEDGKKVKHIMGCWYTNLDLKKRHDGLWHIGDKFDQSKAHKYYEGFEENYPKYDNYDAIDVSKVQDIPIDYAGIMGVPITFVDKFNPKEFKILGLSQKEGLGLQSTVDYSEYKEVRQNGKFTGASGKKTNGNPVLKGKPKKGNFYINKEGRTVFSLYGRIFVQNLHPIKRSDDTGY